MKLGYYTPQFPMPQGRSAGPYPAFPGRRSTVPTIRVETCGSLRSARSPHAARIKAHRKLRGDGCACHAHARRCACHMRGLGDGLIDMVDANGNVIDGTENYQPPTDPTSAPTSTAGFPAGSTLTYSASWGTHGVLTADSGSSVAKSIAGPLAAMGIYVTVAATNSIFNTQNSLTLNVLTTEDYGAAADVKSIIDHQIYLASGTGALPTSTYTTLTVAVPGTAAANPNSPSQLPTWLTQYGLYIAAGLLAFVVIDR